MWMLADERLNLDARILRLAQSGRSREACTLLSRAYGAEILGACTARLGDRESAEDAAQDSLARALVALPGYRGTAGLRSWIHRIAANRCVDLLRSRKSRMSRQVDGVDAYGVAAPLEPLPRETAERDAERGQRVATVRTALARVKEPDRTWLELHYTHGTSYDEIAAEAGISRAAVKQRIWRAMKRVRALLAAAGEGQG